MTKSADDADGPPRDEMPTPTAPAASWHARSGRHGGANRARADRNPHDEQDVRLDSGLASCVGLLRRDCPSLAPLQLEHCRCRLGAAIINRSREIVMASACTVGRA